MPLKLMDITVRSIKAAVKFMKPDFEVELENNPVRDCFFLIYENKWTDILGLNSGH